MVGDEWGVGFAFPFEFGETFPVFLAGEFDAATGTFLSISDDRSERGPARFYRLRLAAPKEGGSGPEVTVEGATPLLAASGEPRQRGT